MYERAKYIINYNKDSFCFKIVTIIFAKLGNDGFSLVFFGTKVLRAFYGTVALASYLFGGAKAPLSSLIHWHWTKVTDFKEFCKMSSVEEMMKDLK